MYLMKKIIILIAAFILSAIAAFCADFSVYKLDNGQTVIIQEVKNKFLTNKFLWKKFLKKATF